MDREKEQEKIKVRSHGRLRELTLPEAQRTHGYFINLVNRWRNMNLLEMIRSHVCTHGSDKNGLFAKFP